MLPIKAKILIVDDLPENLHAMKITLAPLEQVEIFTAHSGNEALTLVLEHEFSVVLLDVQMPEMDGFETAALMQNHPTTQNVPIIFVTAISKDDEHVYRGYKTGAVDYLFKPLNHDILISKVKVFLNLYRQRIEYEQMQKEIQNLRNLEALGVLAGGIAHDFNNLMTTVFANIELAHIRCEPQSIVGEKLKEALKGVDQAQYLTQRLLTFSKGGQPNKKKADIAAMLTDISGKLLSNSNIHVHIEVKTKNNFSEIDTTQINQVFENLILNAKDVMPKGGELHIIIENTDFEHNQLPLQIKKGTYLKITLKDQGPGMEKDILDRVFDPYFSTKEKGPHKGQGLGLAIVHSIIQKHNGYIFAESEPGAGTAFIIYLPAKGKVVDIATETAKSISTSALTTDQKRLLILEDEENVAEVLVEMLKCIGYDAYAAGNAPEAVALYSRSLETPTQFAGVIIGDCEIGLKTLKELQELNPQVLAIVTSGYTKNPSTYDYHKIGFKEIIRKPFTFDSLSRTLNKIF